LLCRKSNVSLGRLRERSALGNVIEDAAAGFIGDLA
jgi:hypothetical protein